MHHAISIIVPVYNIEQHLRKCLNSILTQTFTDFEVIIINDGSTDQSGKICDEFAAVDARIKVSHKAFGGVSSARNVGVKLATGRFIGFVDGDDHIDKDMYRTLYQLCIETASDISVCRLGREVDGELVNHGGEFYTKELNHLEAMRELFKGKLFRFSLCNKLFNRSCFENIYFPEGRIHEDLATTYRLFANANKAVYINYVGYIYVKQQHSILTSKYQKKRLEAFDGWEEIMQYMGRNYPELTKEVSSCFAYNCLDHIYYILNQVGDKKARNKYLSCIQILVRKYYKNIRKNAALSFGYGCRIGLVNYNVGLLAFVFGLRHCAVKDN